MLTVRAAWSYQPEARNTQRPQQGSEQTNCAHHRVDPNRKKRTFRARGSPDALRRLCSAADWAMGMSSVTVATVAPTPESTAQWDNPHQRATAATSGDNRGQSSAV